MKEHIAFVRFMDGERAIIATEDRVAVGDPILCDGHKGVVIAVVPDPLFSLIRSIQC